MSDPLLHVTIVRLDEYDDISYHEVPIIKLSSAYKGESRQTGVGHLRKGGTGFVFEQEKDAANVPLIFQYDPLTGMQLSVQINKSDVGTKLVSTAPGVANINVPCLGDLHMGKVSQVEM